jgi:hypothetical protein
MNEAEDCKQAPKCNLPKINHSYYLVLSLCVTLNLIPIHTFMYFKVPKLSTQPFHECTICSMHKVLSLPSLNITFPANGYFLFLISIFSPMAHTIAQTSNQLMTLLFKKIYK